MPAILNFNALRFVDCLKTGGIEPSHAQAQARALAEVFAENAHSLVDKEDLKQLEACVDNKFELQRKDMRQEFDKARHEVDVLRKDMQAMELRLLVKLGTIVVASVSLWGLVLGFLIKMH